MAVNAAVICGSAMSAKFGGVAANLTEVALQRMTARVYVMWEVPLRPNDQQRKPRGI